MSFEVIYLIIKCTINNKEKELSIRPDDFLADTLRENGYVSVKKGCDTGSCGLCTVMVNDKAVLSCNYLTARVDGQHITTLEGVLDEAKKFGDFLADEGADQCGFCAPGFIMMVLAMKRELQNPTEEEVIDYVNGNLCRCTGYKGQLRAIHKYLNT
ncbi:(2Fe-2S)-binding protein [Clostridioides difficile]|uniref:Xanthine dehydrogenase iron-sulfur binding subunit n=5 Tax=Clostridioides difficile TaxID=1496 RepID=A0A9R0BKZ3_CLODR|nr:2Fe-2S iron-sulfur cluster-binding protein [Clostridioides difficile]EHJ27463.1 2Fe-2S iron-sulfur cluster-binding domain protein [Clostridioides difficile 050-P50-2011]EHJ40500.1 2Fe-2S iron-sulfur cluster-binding domain protein [Clostridioides difficile 70-100-2010]CBA63733.1 xanthine dehydrogenase iron-sulfur binding subunit [Clostridioides difficile CD196]CBE04960.1 xanthine dehydrogenase iron-sulfur binding subunit [Clostridioides difficile R20291]EHJ29506.1 2Fe-2S iron-sulfur cluster-